MDVFRDMVEGAAAWSSTFELGPLHPIPRRRLAIVTCMDCRIDPLAIFGFAPGDVHVVRNAGARMTADMLRSLIKSVDQLEVERIAIVHHTDCGAAKIDLPSLRDRVVRRTGNDPTDVDFHLIADPAAALAEDVEAVRSCPFLPVGTAVAGFVYDVATGTTIITESTFVG
ncbi:MAG: carbonic anhydrase [Acidimicrobiia bacterium]|nr:carbonic anhydrase [Acidimicrobiia bacterium]